MFENNLDSLERWWYKDRNKERKEVRKENEKGERMKEIKLKKERVQNMASSKEKENLCNQAWQ